VSDYRGNPESPFACESSACTYAWQFPDGASGSGQTITHRYERPVTPSMTYLTVTAPEASGGSTSVTCVDEGMLPPRPLSVTCRAEPSMGTFPLDVILGATPDGCVGPCHFAWDFGDGQQAEADTLSVVHHTYAQAHPPGPTAPASS
jgi:PKD repeat protein